MNQIPTVGNGSPVARWQAAAKNVWWPAKPCHLYVAVLLAAGVTGCNRSNAETTSADKKKQTAPQAQVLTVKPKNQTVRRTCNQPAYVAAFQETPLYSKISGYVQEPEVDIGDIVQKDQVLVELWVTRDGARAKDEGVAGRAG